MRLVIATVTLMAACPAWAAPPARAQDGCAPHSEVVEFLARDYDEAPVGSGIANNGGLVEVYASPDRTTWTLLITMPNGRTCMMAAGNSWVDMRAMPDAEAEAEPPVAAQPEPGM